MLSYRRETALQVALVLAKNRKLELGDNIIRTLEVHLQPLWHNRPAKLPNSMKNCKIRAITLFKVIKGHWGRYQLKARIRLVSNSNWHPISYRFGVIAAYCSNLYTAFLSPLWGLRDNVRRLSWAHWKARSGLPISVNWLFFARCYGWGATSENRSKMGDLLQHGQFDPKFQVEGVAPNRFCMDS